MKKLLTALLFSGLSGLLPAATPGEVFRSYSAEDLCVDIAVDLTASSTEVYKRHLDMEGFLARAVPAGIRPEYRNAYRQLVTRGMEGTALVADHEPDSVWYGRLLQRGDAGPVCQVEMGNDNGMVALDLVLGSRDGRPVIVDVLDYSDGQMRSASFQRVLSLMVPPYEWDEGRERRDAGMALDAMARQKIGVFMLAVSRRDAALARSSFAALPAAAQQDPFLISRYVFAVRSDEGLYQAGLKQLADVAGHDPTFSLLLSDYYIERKDRAWMKQVSPALSRRIGELPPGLNLMRGLAILVEDDNMLRQSIADSLQHIDGEETLYLSITRHSLRRNDYDTALLAMDVLKKRFGYVFTEDFKTEDADMQRLKNTAQYKAWLKRG